MFAAQNILINYYGTKTFHKQASTQKESTQQQCVLSLLLTPKPFINTKYTHMNTTKIMLAVIATLTITAMTIGMIAYLLSDMTYKQSMQQPAVWLIMLVFGWIPAVVVGTDLDEKLKHA